MPLSDEDHAKIGEIIATSLQAGMKSLSEMLATTIQHAVKTVLDGAAQEGEAEAAADEGAVEELNEHEEPDGDEGPSEDDEPGTEDAEAPPATDDDESEEKNEAGSTPSGSNTSVPSEIEDEDEDKEKMCADPSTMDDKGTLEKNRMKKDSESITLARYSKRVETLEATNKKLEDKIAVLERNSRNASRERDLIQVEAEGYEIDRAQELEDADGFDDARWSKHVEKIRARYSRKPIDADEVPVVKERPGAPGEEQEMSEDEVKADRAGLLKFSAANAGKYRNEIELVEAYKSSKKAAKA